jgi:hypothetical protein
MIFGQLVLGVLDKPENPSYVNTSLGDLTKTPFDPRWHEQCPTPVTFVERQAPVFGIERCPKRK